MKKHPSRKISRFSWRLVMGALGFLGLTASACQEPVNNQNVDVWQDTDLQNLNLNVNAFVPGDRDTNRNSDTIVNYITKNTFDVWKNDGKTHIVFVGSAACPYCRMALQGDITWSGGLQEFISSLDDESNPQGELQWLPSNKTVVQNSDEKLVGNEPFRGPFVEYANAHSGNNEVQFDVFYDTGLIDLTKNEYAPIGALLRNDTQSIAFKTFTDSYVSNNLIETAKEKTPDQDGGWKKFGSGIPLIFAYRNGEIIHHANSDAEKGTIPPLAYFYDYDATGEKEGYYINDVLDKWLPQN